MNSFDLQLEKLVNEWLVKGDDPLSMIKKLTEQIEFIVERIERASRGPDVR